MDSAGTKALEVLRPFEQTMERAGPTRILIEQIAFRNTSAGDEDPIQAVRGSRRFVSPLAVSVDVEADDRLNLGTHAWVRVDLKAQAGWEYVVDGSIAHPPSSDKLCRDCEKQQDERCEEPNHNGQSAHAPYRARKRRKCIRRST
jgi:hypothetical protein